MKRYRYGTGSQKHGSLLNKARPFILLVVGWHLVGFVAWKYVNSSMAKNDPGWESRTETERIAALTGSGIPDSSQYKKYSFFGAEKKDSESDS